MKNLGFFLCFIFIASCFHEKMYSCSSPRQTDVFVEIKNNKFYKRFSGKSKFEDIPVLINNKMEIVALLKYKYTGESFRYSLNKIENKLTIKQSKRGKTVNIWNYKCTKKR